MAEIGQKLDDIRKSKALLISKILHPKNLKKAIFIGSIIIFIIIIAVIILETFVAKRPYSTPYQYNDLPGLRFTSDLKPYGSFFFNSRVYLEHKNKDMAEEIKNREKEVNNVIMNAISQESYYMINSVEKRKHYLAGRVKKKLNFLLQTEGGINLVDFYSVSLKLNKSKSYKKNAYYNLGTFTSKLIKHYKFEVHMVYDSSSIIFNKLLRSKHDELVSQIKIRIGATKIAYHSNDISSFKKELIFLITKEIKLFLSAIEDEFSNSNPLYEKRNRLKDVLFTLFRPCDEDCEL